MGREPIGGRAVLGPSWEVQFLGPGGLLSVLTTLSFCSSRAAVAQW